MPKRFSGDIVCRKRNSSPAALAAFKNWNLWHNVTQLCHTTEWHYCDTIETKAAVVIILLDGNANSPKKGKKHEPWFARGHLCAQITLSRGGVPRFPISIRARQMIRKTRVCRGKGWQHPWEPLLLFVIEWEIRFNTCTYAKFTNSKKLTHASKPNRGCRFRGFDWTQTYKGIIPKNCLCLCNLLPRLSRFSSVFSGIATKWIRNNNFGPANFLVNISFSAISVAQSLLQMCITTLSS